MATKPRIAPDGAAVRDRGIRIFLSYKSEDEERAKQLETTLRAAGQDRIDIFRARQIPYGANWRSLIREKIADSDILLLLYTDDSRSWAWCLFECGMFLRSIDEAESPLICLHHPEARPPDALSHLQSFTATKDNARKLLEYLLIKYPHDHRARPINPNLFTDDYRPILDLYCGQIIRATGEKAEQYYVHDAWLTTKVCLEDVIIRQDDRGRTTYYLRPDVRVEMSFSLAALLGLQQTSVVWERLGMSSVNDRRWLGALSSMIYEFIKKNKTHFGDHSILQMFRSQNTNRLYRPYVHEVDRGADGKYCFHVHFMEESCLDYQSLSPQLGSLFTGMTLGVRFRHELLKQYCGRLDDWVLLKQNCRDVIRDIWHTIEQIEQEANARGINDPQLFPSAFGDYREEIGGMFDRWDSIRKQLVQVCSACESCERDKKDRKSRCDPLNNMDRLLDELWDMNRRFLFVASARIHEVVAAEV